MTADSAHEARARLAGEQARQRGLAAPGRPPQDQRRQLRRLERAAQQLAGAEQVLLPDELVERSRPHPLGQRLAAAILGGVRAKKSIARGV